MRRLGAAAAALHAVRAMIGVPTHLWACTGQGRELHRPGGGDQLLRRRPAGAETESSKATLSSRTSSTPQRARQVPSSRSSMDPAWHSLCQTLQRTESTPGVRTHTEQAAQHACWRDCRRLALNEPKLIKTTIQQPAEALPHPCLCHSTGTTHQSPLGEMAAHGQDHSLHLCSCCAMLLEVLSWILVL